MPPTRRLLMLRIMGLGAATVLMITALFGITEQLTRPDFRAGDLYVDNARPPVGIDATARSVTLNGDISSDFATFEAISALQTPAKGDQTRLLKNAEANITSVLSLSPANSLLWMTLGIVRIEAREPAASALKASYVTGPLGPAAMVRRIHAVVTSDAVNDEETRFLARTDVRSILTKHSQLHAALIQTYRQASAPGKTFLAVAAQTLSPPLDKTFE